MEVTTNNYDITNKNLIAHLRFVAIIFQRPDSAPRTESRLKFSFLLSLKIIPRIYSPQSSHRQ